MKPKEVETESNTKAGIVFNISSLSDRLQNLRDERKLTGLRYSLGLILLIIMQVKVGGENPPSGITG